MKNEHIGKKLKELRVSRKLRQYEVAEAVGVSRAMISNLEAGRRSLTLETLKAFADYYKISLEYFELAGFSETDEVTDLLERTRKIFESGSVSMELKSGVDTTTRAIFDLWEVFRVHRHNYTPADFKSARVFF